jgi:hypothetical protein
LQSPLVAVAVVVAAIIVTAKVKRDLYLAVAMPVVLVAIVAAVMVVAQVVEVVETQVGPQVISSAEITDHIVVETVRI